MKSWHLFNLFILVISVAAAIILSRSEIFKTFLLNLGNLTYLGAFLGGMLFVSTFTFSSGSVVLMTLADKLSILELSVLAGAGAVIGNLIILKFIQDDLIADLKPIYDQLGGKPAHHLIKEVFHSKHFRWLPTIAGAAFIALPLPDEFGVILMGLSKLKTYQFIVISFLLHSIGIFSMISISNIL